MTEPVVVSFEVPGTACTLIYERDETQRLLAIRGGGRTYLEDRCGVRSFDGGWARFCEAPVDRGFVRRAETHHGDWREDYRWDADGYPVHIDGVAIARDDRGRVIACRGHGVEWRYGYAGDHLVVIEGPHGTRYLTRGPDGRPLRARQNADVRTFRYDEAGRRLSIEAVPRQWCRDDLGRLWAVLGRDGQVRSTFLWDGFACLGCIDGPPGAPLASVYSLDASRTPVRVITADTVTVIPRDAFGEGLLARKQVPGLHGGAIHEGLVYLRSRVADPRCGSYDRLDPHHGGDDDPRRERGYEGPLPVETASTGPYAVCRYDGMSFVDPTGESTGLLILSDLTWSFVHNVTNWVGMDLTINFWLSLFGAPAGQMKEFFEFEGFSSDRTGAFATRRNGVLAGERAFTLQHQIWSDEITFKELGESLVFDPRGRFEPSLYGSVLRGVPSSGSPFLLRGNLDPQAMPGTVPWNWSRSGGPAEAVVPGSLVPWFPSGGLHFDNVYRNVYGPQSCTLTELIPVAAAPFSATVVQGTLFADTATAPAGLSANDEVILIDGTQAADIKMVFVVAAQGGGSRIRFANETTPIQLNNVRLRGLTAPSAQEAINAGGPANGLSTAGTTLPFAAGDPVRLRQGGNPVGAALISRLEGRAGIDGRLPAGSAVPIDVQLASATGPVSAALTLTGNALSGAPLPGPGAAIAVTGNGVTLGCIVGGTAAAPILDRTAAELAPLGASVTWQALTPGASIGQATAVDAGATITITLTAPRSTPAAGFLIVKAAGSLLPTAARRITGANYDAIVLASALPGNAAAAYTIERFGFEAPDLANLTLGTLGGLSLNTAAALPGQALQLNMLAGPALAAGTLISAATLNGAAATLTAAPAATPNPSQVLILQDTATNALEAVVVANVQVALRFDRAVAGLLADTRLVPLAVAGFVYDATLNADATVTALPMIGAGATAVQLPRFRVGEIVQVAGGGLATARLFRITTVAGTTLTLAGDTALVPPLAGLTVQRMAPGAPAVATGTPWLGIRGAAAAGGANTDVVFQVWRPNDVTAAVGPVCIVSRDPANAATPAVVIPARIAAVQSVQATFTAAPTTIGANCTVTDPQPTIFYASSFTQTGVDLVLNATLPNAPAIGSNLVIAVPYAAASPAISANGQMGPGTVLCPVDPETWEFDRKQALAEHELTHSVQSAKFGQIYWGIWPLWAHEGLMEAFSDVELPAFSPYVDGKVEVVGSTKVLRIPAPGAVVLETGVSVQIAAATGATTTAVLGAPADGGGFVLPSDLDTPQGDVRIRRQTGGAGVVANEVIYNIFRVTSLGGLMTIVGGAIWGGLIFGIGKLAYLMSRRLFGGGQSFPGTIENAGLAVRVTSPEGLAAVQGFNEIILRGDSDSATRTVKTMEGNLLTLEKAVELRGSVGVVPYKSDDIWDWHSYFPASVPDGSRPARIQVAPRGSDTLRLHQFDRVTVHTGTQSFRTNVTAVISESLVELEREPPASARAAFQIAFVDSNDPINSIDSRMLAEMGVGWLRWFFDPFGQFQYRTHPGQGSWQDIVARIARYGWSTKSWSWPIPGILFILNLFKQIGGGGHLSPLEQEASENSGNLYSPLAKLRGGFTEVDGQHATYNATVGDLARYWHTPFHGFNGGSNGPYAPSVTIQTNQRDTPGPHLQPWIRIVPNVQGTPGAPEPNGTVAPANPAIAGQFVPDLLVTKLIATPDVVAAAAPAGFVPTTLAQIPCTPTLNQSIGAYVGFTQPGTHRLTIQTGIHAAVGAAGTDTQGRQAHEAKVQTLWFDVVTSDVTVTIAGSAIAQSAPLASVTLVLLQQVAVAVTPNTNRRYTLTILNPGRVLQAPPSPLTLAAGTALGNETVEISRVYTFNAGAFDSAVLGQHGGMHLGDTFHVPVRSFTVQVVNSLPLRDAAEPTATVLATLVPGNAGFLLVPVDVQAPPTATFTYPGGALAGRRDPALLPAQVTPLSATASAFVGPSGQVFRLPFDDPPEDAAAVTLTVVVRSGATNASLTCGPIPFAPHFSMIDAAGTYRLRQGQTLVLTCNNGVQPTTVAVDGAGVSHAESGAAITLTATAAAPLGPRTVTCADAADATRRARRTITVVA